MGCCMLRATLLVFERRRFPVLWCVLIRAPWLCEYVYKMLTTVSLSVTSDPRTSTRDTVPVSSCRLHVESGPDPVTRRTAQPNVVCQPKPTSHLPHSWRPCPLSFNLLQIFTYPNGCVLSNYGCSMSHWKGDITKNLYLYLFFKHISGIMQF